MALAQPRFQGSLLTGPISLAQQGWVGENPGNKVVSLLSRASAKMPLHLCLVPRRLSFDENVRAKEGGKETTGETSSRSCFQDGGKSNGGRICSF